MERTRYRLRLDLNDPAAAVTIHAKRCDSGRSILATLLSGGVVYPVSDDLSAVFTARKPDGKVLYNACTIEAGRIRYDLTPQTTAAAGLMECELRLFRGEQLITSPRFHLMVEDTVYDENAEIESTSEFTTLTGLVGKIEEMLRNGDFKGDPFTYEDFTAEQLEDLRASLYGYYVPDVDGTGNLTWQPTASTMPAVPAANIRGPAPVLGADYFTEADKASMVEQVLAKTGDTFAPNGYGLGGQTMGNDIWGVADLDNHAANGWYYLSCQGESIDGYALNGAIVRISNATLAGPVMQEVFPLNTNYCVRRIRNTDGVWQPWEWEDPPMVPGVLYRTAKYCENKPVYKLRLDCGALPNAATAYTSLGMSVAAYGADVKLVGADLVVKHPDTPKTQQFANPSVVGGVALAHKLYSNGALYHFGITTGGDLSAYTAAVTLELILGG